MNLGQPPLDGLTAAVNLPTLLSLRSIPVPLLLSLFPLLSLLHLPLLGVLFLTQRTTIFTRAAEEEREASCLAVRPISVTVEIPTPALSFLWRTAY